MTTSCLLLRRPEGVLGASVSTELKAGKCFQGQSFAEYLRYTLSQVQLFFFGMLLLVLAEFSFPGGGRGGGDWALGDETIILWRFEIFLIFLNFLRSYVLSSLAACEAIRLDQFITNNHNLFHLW